jgi:ABC-type transport system substrate-binding protein
MAVRKDWPVVAGLLDKGLATMTADERIRIEEKWGVSAAAPVAVAAAGPAAAAPAAPAAGTCSGLKRTAAGPIVGQARASGRRRHRHARPPPVRVKTGQPPSPTPRSNPARARALLDLHGYLDRNGDGWRERPDGSPLLLEVATQPTQAARQLDELMRRDMAALQLRTDFRPATWPEQYKAARAGKLMMWSLSGRAGAPDGIQGLLRYDGAAAGGLGCGGAAHQGGAAQAQHQHGQRQQPQRVAPLQPGNGPCGQQRHHQRLLAL